MKYLVLIATTFFLFSCEKEDVSPQYVAPEVLCSKVTPVETDTVLIFGCGQSNMGHSYQDADVSVPPNLVHNFECNIGWYTALEYSKNNPQKVVVYSSVAVQNTGFVDNRWNGDLKEAVVNKYDSLAIIYGDISASYVIWHQGETDAIANNSRYATELTNLVDDLRSEIGDFRFICGTMRGSWMHNGKKYVDPIHREICKYVDNSACVNLDDYSGYDDLHFYLESIPQIGKEYYLSTGN